MKVKITRYLIPLLILTIIITFCSFSCSPSISAEIDVYLKDNISDELKESIEQEIKSWGEVKEVKYISKEQAFERFKEQNKGSDILKEIGGNPVPASFEITLNNPEKIDQVALRFYDKNGNFIEGVNDVIYSSVFRK